MAAIAALEGDQQCVRDIAEQYRQRRNVLVKGLHEAGWMVENPKASMYVWAKIPEPYAHLGSLEFAKRLLAEAKVCVSPGIGFGDYGDTHVRFALIENQGPYPPGGARHQGDVPCGRLAEAGQGRQRQIILSGRAFARPYFRPKVFFIISPLCSTTLNFIFG